MTSSLAIEAIRDNINKPQDPEDQVTCEPRKRSESDQNDVQPHRESQSQSQLQPQNDTKTSSQINRSSRINPNVQSVEIGGFKKKRPGPLNLNKANTSSQKTTTNSLKTNISKQKTCIPLDLSNKM